MIEYTLKARFGLIFSNYYELKGLWICIHRTGSELQVSYNTMKITTQTINCIITGKIINMGSFSESKYIIFKDT